MKNVNKPVRPKAYEEYMAKNKTEQPKVEINTKQAEVKEEKKTMNPILKLLIGLACTGCVAAIGFGIFTFNTAKDTEVKQAAAAVQIQATDKTATEKEVEKALAEQEKTAVKTAEDYQKEAEQAFKNSGLDAKNKDAFIDTFVQYRLDGFSTAVANKMVAEEINNIEKAEAEPEVEDEVIEVVSEDKAAPTPTIEVEEKTAGENIDFQVLAMDDVTMYAQAKANVRTGPSTTYEKIKSLKVNEVVIVHGLVPVGENGWYQIYDKDKEEVIGYVSGSLLDYAKVVAKTTTTTTATTPAATAPAVTTPAPAAPAPVVTTPESDPTCGGIFNNEIGYLPMGTGDVSGAGCPGLHAE